jgi:ABC-2 type transport system permease protein
VKRTAPARSFAASADPRGTGGGNPARRLVSFLSKTAVIAGLEARKLRHDPTELLTRAVQPALWLLVFGQVFTHLRAIPTGGMRYVDFMAPGILAQAIIVFLLALVLGVRMNWNPAALAGVLLTVLLGAALFSTFSLVVACLVKTRERFMGIGQIMTMPLFFASNAIYPIQLMPHWLQAIARANPLSYEVDALRALMLAGGSSAFGLGVDYLVLASLAAALVLLAARLYPRVAV